MCSNYDNVEYVMYVFWFCLRVHFINFAVEFAVLRMPLMLVK